MYPNTESSPTCMSRYLSLIGNPCCPAELTGGSAEEYDMYIDTVAVALPLLTHLDSAPVPSRNHRNRSITSGNSNSHVQPMVASTAGGRVDERASVDRVPSPKRHSLSAAERKVCNMTCLFS